MMGTPDFSYQGGGGAPVAVGVAAPVATCPLCRKVVTPDALGLLECPCGWGGLDDPLESARGFSRWVTGLDRRMATRQARRDLRRIAGRHGEPPRPGIVYRALLWFASTLVHLLILALLAGAVWLIYTGMRDQAWLGVVVGAVIVAVLALPLLERPRKVGEITATRAAYPMLFGALDEVAQRVRVSVPRKVVIVPDANFAMARRRSARHPIRGESVLLMGACALPLLTTTEAKSILAHELAHARYGDSALHGYARRAEAMLLSIIQSLVAAVSSQRRATLRDRRYVLYGTGTGGLALGAYLVFIVTLPLGAVLVLFHLLRLRESRNAEFRADAEAVRAYGAHAFTNALTGVAVTQRTLRTSGGSLLRSGPNYLASAAAHYASLPPSAVVQLRFGALRGYRSLEDSHPITADRARAALLMSAPIAEPPQPVGSARSLLAATDGGNGEPAELQVTALLRGRGTARKRRQPPHHAGRGGREARA